MNTAQLKLISWSLAALFGAGLAAYVGNYLMHRTALEKRVAPEEIRDALAKVAPVEKKAEDIVAYERVNQALFKYNWTGKAPPPPPKPEGPKDTGPVGPVAVNTLIKVLLIKADPIDDSGSRVVIKYLPAARVTTKDPTIVKHVGDTLDAPHEGIIVADIFPDYVLFKFADAARATEQVMPDEFPRRLDMKELARLGGSSLPRPEEVRYERTANYGEPPEHTTRLGDDSYQIGTADMEYLGDNYQDALSEVEMTRHRDPNTGKYDGIALTSVPAGSVAAAHGAKDGDVIKSINGHPVNSTQEAISFVQNNKDKYDVWEVEIDSKGKIHVITYKVPKKKH